MNQWESKAQRLLSSPWIGIAKEEDTTVESAPSKDKPIEADPGKQEIQ